MGKLNKGTVVQTLASDSPGRPRVAASAESHPWLDGRCPHPCRSPVRRDQIRIVHDMDDRGRHVNDPSGKNE